MPARDEYLDQCEAEPGCDWVDNASQHAFIQVNKKSHVLDFIA
jgi:hypothetical protein